MFKVLCIDNCIIKEKNDAVRNKDEKPFLNKLSNHEKKPFWYTDIRIYYLLVCYLMKYLLHIRIKRLGNRIVILIYNVILEI